MENILVIIIDIITLIISVIFFFKSISKLQKKRYTVYFIHIIFFMVYVFPIALDYFYTFPNYGITTAYFGFFLSYKDIGTRLIYDIYILICQLIILYSGQQKFNRKAIKAVSNIRNKEILIKKFNSPLTNYTLFFLGGLPVILALVSPLPKQILFTPSWRGLGILNMSENMNVYYYFLERISYIGLVSGAIFILANKRKHVVLKFLSILFIGMAICIESKRAILAIFLLVIVAYIFYNSVKINKKLIILILCIVFSVLLYYSIFIHVEYRGYSFDTYRRLYTLLRIDFFRDDRVRMVIYSLLHPDEMKILNYPGQSFINQIGAIFPLEFLGVPVTGYNSYFTCALRGIPFVKSVNSMTTSIFDEFLANFSIFGFWLAPLMYGKICRSIDRHTNILKPLIIVMLVLMMMFSLNYILWFIQICLFVLMIEKYLNINS